MGIKYLNRFLKEECKDSIKLISLKELSGKKIAIDISIYLYKYAADNTLIENIYLMLSIFRHYKIIPIFIFDGKPPSEKKELLIKRQINKKESEEEYKNLKKQLELNPNMDEIEKQEIMNNMDLLKKKFIQISKEDIESVKNLIRAYGATYFDAPCEADELCALLALKGKVWACLSEDMDMFVYGCPRVIRYLSLLNHTVVLYDLKGILYNLGITQKELREICILSGTDYNINSDTNNKRSPDLYTTLKYFKKFHKDNNKDINEFYDWLQSKTNYITNYDTLKNIYNMFDITTNNDSHLHIFEDIKIINGQILYDEMKEILKKDGFIFPIIQNNL
jgi:5'-3' exonuclease